MTIEPGESALIIGVGPIGLAATVGGAAIGGLAAKLHDSGFNDERLRRLGQSLQPNTSAILAVIASLGSQFVLAGKDTLPAPPGTDPTQLAVQRQLLRDQLDEQRARLDAAKLVIDQRQAGLAATNANIDRLKAIIPLLEERATSYHQLWQKTYRVRLDGIAITPPDVIREWKANYGVFWPKGNHFYAPQGGIRPGVVVLHMGAQQARPVEGAHSDLNGPIVNFDIYSPAAERPGNESRIYPRPTGLE